jgi:hypothetical protein
MPKANHEDPKASKILELHRIALDGGSEAGSDSPPAQPKPVSSWFFGVFESSWFQGHSRDWHAVSESRSRAEKSLLLYLGFVILFNLASQALGSKTRLDSFEEPQLRLRRAQRICTNASHGLFCRLADAG